MWIVHPNRRGVAAWQTGNAVWLLEARGGSAGILWRDGEDADCVYASFNASGDQTLPELDEQFVRGDELHLRYPQGEGEFGLRLVIRPIISSTDCLVMEVVTSIETVLLDSHPTVDLRATGERQQVASKSDLAGTAISLAASPRHQTAILLGQHDSPFTTDLCDKRIELRLFGEFLEKGVIRKARPWIVIDRSGERLEPAQLHEWLDELTHSPLPLTS